VAAAYIVLHMAIGDGVLPWDVLLAAAQGGWGVVERLLVLCVILGMGWVVCRDRRDIFKWLREIWTKRKK
jgi:hypothetical protein